MRYFQNIEIWARKLVALEIIALFILAIIGTFENHQFYTYSTGTYIGEEWVDTHGNPVPTNGFDATDGILKYDIYYTLPKTSGNQMLVLRARHVYLDIYVNDVLFSADSQIKTTMFTTLGSRWHFVPISQKDTPVTIHINVAQAFESSRCAINRIYYGTHQEIIRATIAPLLGIFLSSCILFVVGLSIFFIYMIFRKKLPLGRDIIYLCCCTMLTTTWTAMDSLFLQFIFGYSELFQLFGYLAFVSVPLPLGLLTYYRAKGKERVFAGFYVTFSILNVLVCCTLHLTGIVEFHRMLTPTHILLVLMLPLLYSLIGSFLKDEHTQKYKTTLYILLIAASLCITIGLSCFILRIFVDYSIMALIVIVILNIFLLLYNYHMCVNMFRKGLEADFMHELALRDHMTNLYNRTGFAEHEENYNQLIARRIPIGIVQFDLNNLKTVNDTLGHDQGDVLISSFAAYLKASFAGKGNCYRMGGDEFLVILHGQDPEKSYRIGIDTLHQYCDHHNQTSGASYYMESAHGFVLSRGTPLADAMAMADAKMYETKKILKENRSKKV